MNPGSCPTAIELSDWRENGPLSPTLSPSAGEREKIRCAATFCLIQWQWGVALGWCEAGLWPGLGTPYAMRSLDGVKGVSEVASLDARERMANEMYKVKTRCPVKIDAQQGEGCFL